MPLSMSQCVNLYSTSLMRYRSAKTVRTEMSLAGAWKQLRWSSDCGQGPEYCSRPTDQQWQKPGGHKCWGRWRGTCSRCRVKTLDDLCLAVDVGSILNKQSNRGQLTNEWRDV